MSVYCTPRLDGPNSLHDKEAKMFVKVWTSDVYNTLKTRKLIEL